MVAQDYLTGLYVAVPTYFVLLGGATYWAYRRMERMKHEGVNDHLSAHYLGGRDFGPWLTAGTMFASLFSGYTVVGIPNEAFKFGWAAFRWMPSLSGIVFGYLGTSLRLRKASLLRNHQSPVDFITDRYQSQVLRYTMVFQQVVPTIIYLAAQVIAIKSTFNSIFGLDPDTAYPVVLIMTAILVFEWLGGLSSVALTDAVQALIMVASFVIVPSILTRQFGGWTVLDPETYPKPQLYQTMSREAQWSFWQFSLVNFAAFTLPHLVQRVYSAKDLVSLKTGFFVLTIGPWFTTFVGIFMGTMAVSFLVNEDGTPETPASPFAAILEELMSLGGFPQVAAVIAVTASLAAIMSTADSLINAVSQLVVSEVFYPLRPAASPKQMEWSGRTVSLLSVALSLLLGLYWTSGLSALTSIQFPLSAQALPAFLFGLYSINSKWDVHPWCLSVGALSASVYIFAFYYGYTRDNPDALPMDSGVTGFVLNVTISVSLEAVRRALAGAPKAGDPKADGTRTMQLAYPERPEWDVPKLTRFGEHVLTPQLLWKSMEGVNEAMTSYWFVAYMLFSISMVTPLVAQFEPPINDGVFAYAPSVIRGLPWWAFKIILLCIMPTIGLLVAIYFYPNEFPTIDEKVIETEGIDPDLVEMTPQEMGRRSAYDETNILIHKRRSSISATMDELGIRSVAMDADGQEEGGANRRMSTPSQQRLVSLVSARRLGLAPEAIIDEGNGKGEETVYPTAREDQEDSQSD